MNYFQAVKGRLAWARDPKGRETNLGQLVSQFQFNSDVYWKTWIYSDKIQDEQKCTVLRDYKVELDKCELLLPFICERGNAKVSVLSIKDSIYKHVVRV